MQVRNVTITSMSEEMVQGARIARGTALVTFDKLYSAEHSHEPRTEHWLLSVTYYLNPKQVSDQAKIYPQYRVHQPARIDHHRVPRKPGLRGPVAPGTAGANPNAIAQPVDRSGAMSFQLILPFFPEELRALLLDPSISDLMINGTTGVYRGSGWRGAAYSAVHAVYQRSPAGGHRACRPHSGPGPYHPESDPQYPLAGRLARGRRRLSVFDQWADADHPQIQSLVSLSDELIAAGSLPAIVRDDVVNLIRKRKNGIISGGTGSGKSTLMKALLDHVPLHERLRHHRAAGRAEDRPSECRSLGGC